MADVKLDKEARARMMSLMPCASDGTYEWTPDVFREKNGDEYIVPETQWPVFTLRSMTTQEHTALRKMVLSKANFDKSKPDQVLELSDMMHEAVRKIVTGWRNIIDVLSGNEYPYEQDPSGGILKEKWSRIPDIIKSELFQKVCQVCGLIRLDGDYRMELSKRGF